MKELVEKIRSLCRENPGIKSVTRLEEMLGFGNGAIGKWAKSDKFPPYDRLNAVANALGVSVSYLTGEEQKEKHSTDGEVLKTLTPERYGEFLRELPISELMQLYSEMGEVLKERMGE